MEVRVFDADLESFQADHSRRLLEAWICFVMRARKRSMKENILIISESIVNEELALFIPMQLALYTIFSKKKNKN